MKLKLLIVITLIVPLIALALTKPLSTSLSGVQVDVINFVSVAVLFIAIVDIFFIAFKKMKTKLVNT